MLPLPAPAPAAASLACRKPLLCLIVSCPAPPCRRRTKNDCGDCPLVHDDACKQQWDELDEASRARYG
jgi:hypothetical protein